MKGQAATRSKRRPYYQAKRVFVGLSGGVDSAVSAALLKRSGYDVTGVFIKVWQPDWIECNWREERLEAMRVAAHLDIPFLTLDLVDEYKLGVIDHMIDEYAAGRTPNPDVMCNREVKFGAFWRWAEDHGADYIATGHYARIIRTPSLRLLASSDAAKDQSYFLWTLTPGDLAHTIFPVGAMTKPLVRKLASEYKLPNADKKDSQGLCFMGKIDVKEFLSHYIKDNPAGKPGDVLDLSGKKIGDHPGALFFTIGERHGFTLGKAFNTPNNRRLFVVSKNMKDNTITVANLRNKTDNRTAKSSSASQVAETNMKLEMRIVATNWVSRIPSLNKPVQVRARYRQTLQRAEVIDTGKDTGGGGGYAIIRFQNMLGPVAAGQSMVLYDGEECLGGGIIEGR